MVGSQVVAALQVRNYSAAWFQTDKQADTPGPAQTVGQAHQQPGTRLAPQRSARRSSAGTPLLAPSTLTSRTLEPQSSVEAFAASGEVGPGVSAAAGPRERSKQAGTAMRSGSGFTVPSVFMDSLPAAAGSTFAGASAVDLLGESNMSSAQLPDCPAPDVTSDAVMKRPASLRAQNEVSSTPGRRGWERPPEIGASGLLLPAAPGHTAIASPHSSWLSVSPSSSSGSLAQHLARSSLQAEGAPDAVKGSKPQAISSPGFVHQPITPEDSPTPAAGEGTPVAHERRARSARMPDEGTAAHTPRQRMLRPRQPTHKASLSLPELSVPDSLISSPPGTPRLAAISPRAAATHGGGAASGALSRIASPEPVQTPERGSQFGATSDQFGAGSPRTPAASTTTGSPQAPAPRTPPQAADAPAPGSPPSAKAIFDGARPTPPPSSPHYSAASAVPHSFPPPPRGSPQIPPPPWMSGHASSAYAAGAPLSGDRPPLAQSPKSPVSRPCSTTSQYTTCASHLDESDVGSAGRSSGSNSCVGPRTRLNRRSQLLADGTARAHSRTLAHSNGQNVTADALRPPDPQNMSRAWSNPVFLDVTAPEVAPPVPGRALPMRPQTALGEAHSSDEFWSGAHPWARWRIACILHCAELVPTHTAVSVGRQVDPLPLIPSGEAALRAALPQHSPRLLLSPRPAGAPPTPPNEDACSASTDSSGSLSSLPSGVAPAHARRGSVSSSAAASAAPGSGEADPTVALPGDLPDMLQSFLGRLDTVEKNLHADWESEQHAREAELLRLQHGSARRPAAGDFGVALDVYGVSGPLSNPDDIVADSRSGMRTSRAHFCSPSLTSPHFLVPARDYPSADRVLAASYEAPFTMADAAPDFLRHARSLTPRGAGGAAARELAAAASHVATLERLVTDKMEPTARHIASMKRRMVSAQEEAQLLREELESAQRTQHTLSSASAGESVRPPWRPLTRSHLRPQETGAFDRAAGCAGGGGACVAHGGQGGARQGSRRGQRAHGAGERARGRVRGAAAGAERVACARVCTADARGHAAAGRPARGVRRAHGRCARERVAQSAD